MKGKKQSKLGILANIRNVPRKYNFPVELSFIGFSTVLVFFTINSIFWLNGNTTGNLVQDYLNLNIKIFQEHWFPSIVVFTGYLFLLFKWYRSKKEIGNLKNKTFNTVRVNPGIVFILTILLSFGLAIISTIIIALIQLNLFSLSVRNNLGSSNIIFNIDSISDKINQLDNPPVIIQTTQNDIGKEMIKHYMNKNSKSNFYTNDVLNKIPSYAIFKINLPKSSLVLNDNVLFVNELNKDDLQKISPRLAYLMVRKNFSPRYIKDSPAINVLIRQDYLKFREGRINDQLKEIDDYIAKVQKAISYQTSVIIEDKDNIALNQGNLVSSQQYKDQDYKWCIAQENYSYITRSFIRSYSEDECNRFAASKWDSTINQYQSNFSGLNKQLQSDESLLKAFQELYNYVSQQRSIVESQKDNTPQELGVFYDQNKIEIAMDWTSSSTIYDFLDTLVHEYLHYASYVSDDRVLPVGFEEGLTSTYARQIIKKELSQKVHSGYPVLVKIIQQMQTRLSKEHLEDIYFNKNQALLIDLLDSTYGDKFYEKHEIDFAILPLLPNKEALEIANRMMSEIGGKQLSDADLNSDSVIEETKAVKTTPEDLVNIVKQYYTYIGSKQLDNAWNLLSKNFQSYTQGHDHFVKSYGTTVNNFIEDAHIQDLSKKTVYVRFKSADDVNGQTQYKMWEGIWQLVDEDGIWKLDNANIYLTK